MNKITKKIKKETDNKLAVIQTGGKQYLVGIGQSLKVEKIKGAQKDSIVDFNEVLLVIDGDSVKIGNPVVENAKVKAQVEEEGRNKKITIQKYKAKTRYRLKKGHRQHYMKIKILEIKS